MSVVRFGTEAFPATSILAACSYGFSFGPDWADLLVAYVALQVCDQCVWVAYLGE